MPGLVIDKVGGGNNNSPDTAVSEAIITTIEIGEDQLSELSPVAVYDWLFARGFKKGFGDTVLVKTIIRVPINPHFKLHQPDYSPVVEMNVINPDGLMHDFRMMGDGYYIDVIIKKDQWPDGSLNNLAYMPLGYWFINSGSRDIYVHYSYLNGQGQEVWNFFIADFSQVINGKWDLIINVDPTIGIPADSRAINPEYLITNPNAILKKFKVVDVRGDAYPVDTMGVNDQDVNEMEICNSTSWPDNTSEAYIYIPIEEGLWIPNMCLLDGAYQLQSVENEYDYYVDTISLAVLEEEEVIITAIPIF